MTEEDEEEKMVGRRGRQRWRGRMRVTTSKKGNNGAPLEAKNKLTNRRNNINHNVYLHLKLPCKSKTLYNKLIYYLLQPGGAHHPHPNTLPSAHTTHTQLVKTFKQTHHHLFFRPLLLKKGGGNNFFFLKK